MRQLYYYNSFGNLTPLSEILALETERENQPQEVCSEWLQKYGLDVPAVWVTRSLRTAKRWSEGGLTNRIPRRAGFIIPESDDGDDGFIMIITDPAAGFEYVQFSHY